ncbi:MAG: hypothetical protein R3C61_18605 [Bacteroidia bacterium]
MIQRTIPNDYTRKKRIAGSPFARVADFGIGSSHTYLAILPDSLDGLAFNLSATAQTLYLIIFFFEKYIDKMTSLETVILPISYPSLGAESDRNPEILTGVIITGCFTEAGRLPIRFSKKVTALSICLPSKPAWTVRSVIIRRRFAGGGVQTQWLVCDRRTKRPRKKRQRRRALSRPVLF